MNDEEKNEKVIRHKAICTVTKPENPYRKGSIVWSLMEGDWTDLTAAQIAEVLDTTRASIHAAICRIKADTGYTVPHMTERDQQARRR